MGHIGEYFKEFTESEQSISTVLLKKAFRRLSIGGVATVIPRLIGASTEVSFGIGLAALIVGTFSARLITRDADRSGARGLPPEGRRVSYKGRGQVG